MANEQNLTLYRSPQWALALELYLAIHAVVFGLVGGLDSGILAATLRGLNLHYLWVVGFCLLGVGLFITSALEVRCRRLGKNCECIKRFAWAREKINLVLVPYWGFSVFLYMLSDHRLVLVPAISTQALITVLIIQWENVSAQRLKAEDRRVADSVHVGQRHGFSR